jgi:signal transduction histidine kinase
MILAGQARNVRGMDRESPSAPRLWWRRQFRAVSTGQWIVDGAVGFCFLLFSFGLMGPSTALYLTGAGPYNWLLSGVTVVIMTGALMLSRCAPLLSLIVAWIGALFQMGMGQGPMAANMAIFVVLFAVAAYGTRFTFWAGFVSAFVGALCIAVYTTLVPAFGYSPQPGDPPAADWLLGYAVTVGLIFSAAIFSLLLAWTLGALFRVVLRGRETRRAQLFAEERAAAEGERGRIARDMHDVVAHSLAVVIAQADGARYAAKADPAVASEALTTISQTARSALSDVRMLLTQMRHSQAEGPQPTIADLEQLYSHVRAAGVDLRVTVDPVPPGDPPAAVQLAVYRILQEATTNALRHGDGGPVEVVLSWLPDRVTLRVENGMRQAPPSPREALAVGPASSGHGLIGMRERAELVGGSAAAGAQDGRWHVRAELPIATAP